MKRLFSEIRNHGKYLLLMTAVAFILYGAAREEYLTVLKKAAHICFECIGIG